MRKVNFKVRNIGSEKYLSYVLDDETDLDEELLDYLDDNKIAELIDIRKADLGINKLLLTHQNIAALVAQLFSEIKPWAEKKEIEIQYISEEDNLKMDFDWDKIGKLIINLLSNAIKYTPQKGSISIILKKAAFKDIEPLYQTRYQKG